MKNNKNTFTTLLFVFIIIFINEYSRWDSYKVYKLYKAIASGDKEQTQELISEGVDLNETLVLALDVLDKPSIKFLVEHGANIKEIGNTYLVKSLLKAKMNRFKGDYSDLTQLMIEYKVDLSKSSDYNGYTPLMSAISAKQDKIINTLINIPVNVNVVGNNCETALFETPRADIAKLLVSKGANINHKDCHGATPIVIACAYQNIELVSFYILKGAKVDAYGDREQMDCLLYGIKYENKNLIDLILKARADINDSKVPKTTPLAFAIRKNNLDMVEYLISKGADVNQIEDNSYSPLTEAIQNNSSELIYFLISKGVDVNLKDGNGNLPLILAVAKEDISLVEYLLQQGADINLKDGFGNTALELAEISKNEKLIRILKNASQPH